ncbi:class I SAM-dependent methyltransferase [Methylocapsa sp. D3K7]|uniref:class I SAM-dependent methyltransferase n=1 Tax=Methylocapsa sp. D3K7 TaxID=3041435 RepID=UPI00244EA888|nr:class I SAM-dependent methyltransferase [Methylocapsa sp. D3K7]WGJ14386.1 class I SAM-dependent methyltransferase [Methylocapsa sp. D3K7]
MDKGFFDRTSPEFAARRAEARKLLDSLDPAMQDGAVTADPARQAWFEAVYDLAKGDPARVPWANLAPHPLSQAWVAAQAEGLNGLRILDVGCGLGDNAECFAAAGAHVTAFDFVGEAITWAKQRFPESKVAYAQGDLFALPDAWLQAFDLIHECYTLQALPPDLLLQALAALKSALAPGGRLLIVARAREEAEEFKGPPWPLPPSIFEGAKRQGLTTLSIEDIPAVPGGGSRHWRALLRRAEDA